MKSPIVSKWRNSAPTDTPARLVMVAADARAYPTSTIVSMHASISRATVSSRRCCCVLAISGVRRLTVTRAQEATGLRGGAVSLAEFTVSEYHCAVYTRCDDGSVVAVDDPAQAPVERDLL